jgi:hypothetical protein
MPSMGEGAARRFGASCERQGRLKTKKAPVSRRRGQVRATTGGIVAATALNKFPDANLTAPRGTENFRRELFFRSATISKALAYAEIQRLDRPHIYPPMPAAGGMVALAGGPKNQADWGAIMTPCVLCASKTASEISLFRCVSFGIWRLLSFTPFLLSSSLDRQLLGLLRACRERPYGRRANHRYDEIAPFHFPPQG